MVDDIVATVDKTDKKYDLSEVAAILDVNTSSYKNSNNASKFLVESIITVTDLSISTEPIIEFNGIPSSDLPNLYNSDNNRGDVGVCVKGTTLVDTEVNSSLMSETVRKVILGLVDLVRIVKAHKITEQIKLKLIGFALPKLSAKGLIVEMEVSYETRYIAFMARIHVIDPLKFPGQLSKAIQNNVKILNICKKYCINEDAQDFCCLSK